jgi:hypothetical protein
MRRTPPLSAAEFPPLNLNLCTGINVKGTSAALVQMFKTQVVRIDLMLGNLFRNIILLSHSKFKYFPPDYHWKVSSMSYFLFSGRLHSTQLKINIVASFNIALLIVLVIFINI